MSEPKQITAGLSYSWTKAFSLYKASAAWALSYSIVSGSAQYDIASVASGDNFAVSITQAASLKYAPGVYRLIGFVDDGTDRKQVYCGDLVVSPDFTSVGEFRSFAEIALEAIEALIRKAATKDQQSVMVDGQTLLRRTYTELIMLRDRFKREVASEKRAAKTAAGLGSGGRVQVRFK